MVRAYLSADGPSLSTLLHLDEALPPIVYDEELPDIVRLSTLAPNPLRIDCRTTEDAKLALMYVDECLTTSSSTALV